MARRPDKPHRYWILLVIVVAAFGLWYLVGEVTWRHPETVSDSEDAVVQPAPAMADSQTEPAR